MKVRADIEFVFFRVLVDFIPEVSVSKKKKMYSHLESIFLYSIICFKIFIEKRKTKGDKKVTQMLILQFSSKFRGTSDFK